MPLVEFMLHASPGGNPKKRDIPGFIRGSADFFNSADNTYVGWVADNRDFYLPDTVVVLDKQSFANRLLAIHQHTPMNKMISVTQTEQNPEGIESAPMTDAEVIAMANETYDRIVLHCKTEEGSI